jgi:hypothetical protein
MQNLFPALVSYTIFHMQIGLSTGAQIMGHLLRYFGVEMLIKVFVSNKASQYVLVCYDYLLESQ